MAKKENKRKMRKALGSLWYLAHRSHVSASRFKLKPRVYDSLKKEADRLES